MDLKSGRTAVCLVFLFLFSVILSAKNDAPSINPDQALSILKDGNNRFKNGKRINPNQDESRRKDTAKNGQHPFATILGCSDSRGALEHLFDVGFGDIFAVRVAGNVSGIDEIASIEYATGHLGTPLLVVLGHTQCGAVSAASSKGGDVHGSIPLLLKNIQPAVKKTAEKHGKDVTPSFLNEAVKMNVWQSIEDIISKSHSTSSLVKDKKLKIIGAVYHIDSGEIEWMGEHPKMGELINHSNDTEHLSFLSLSYASAPLLVIMLAAYILFFAAPTRIKKIQIRGRIISGFIALIIGMTAAVALSLFFVRELSQGISAGHLIFMIGLPAAVATMFVFLYVSSIIASFRSVIAMLRGEIEKMEKKE